jgi:hypothetical protein
MAVSLILGKNPSNVRSLKRTHVWRKDLWPDVQSLPICLSFHGFENKSLEGLGVIDEVAKQKSEEPMPRPLLVGCSLIHLIESDYF